MSAQQLSSLPRRSLPKPSSTPLRSVMFPPHLQVERSRPVASVTSFQSLASQDRVGRALSSFPFPCGTSLCPLGSRATLSTVSISAQGVRDRDMHSSNGKCFAKHFSFKARNEPILPNAKTPSWGIWTMEGAREGGEIMNLIILLYFCVAKMDLLRYHARHFGTK